MLLIGEPGAVLKCSNCIGGSVVSIQNAGNIRFENFVLDGGGNTSSGLTLDHVTRSEINNVRVRNVIQKDFIFILMCLTLLRTLRLLMRLRLD